MSSKESQGVKIASDDDDDDDIDARELQTPQREPRRHEEEDSNHYFMSEPSISEGGNSSNRLRTPHRVATDPRRRLSNGEDDDRPRPRSQPSPGPSSPGNTSLSSWDNSPATRRNVHFQFGGGASPQTMDPNARVRVQTTAGGPSVQVNNSNNNNTRSSNNSSNINGGRKTAATYTTPHLPDFSGHSRLNHSSNSSSDASRSRPANVDDFLQSIRDQSSAEILSNDQSHARSTQRNRQGSDYESWTHSESLGDVGDDPAQGFTRTLSDLPITSIHENSPMADDSIVMTLSEDSDQGVDEEENTNATPTMRTSSAHSDMTDQQSLDGEAQNSADDEKTAERPTRVRNFAAKPASGHRRRKSGDQAAATLATGGSSWKGMGRDQIPVPEGDEDDEEDEVELQQAPRPPQRPPRQGRPEERSQQQPTKAAASRRSDQSDSDILRQLKKPRNGRPELGKRAWSLREMKPAKDQQQDQPRAHDDTALLKPHVGGSVQRYGVHENPHGEDESYRQYMATYQPPYSPVYPFQQYPPHASYQSPTMTPYAPQLIVSTAQQQHEFDSQQEWMHNMAAMHGQREFGHNQFSMGSETTHPTGFHTAPPPPPPDELASDSFHKSETNTYDDDKNGDSGSSNTGDEEADVQHNRMSYAPSGSNNLDDLERRYENREFRGSYQHVRRTVLPSPFANIGKKSSPDKISLSAFFPEASILDDGPQKYQTYLCLRCNTHQREFFTVSDAPRQLDGPSAYLGIYFGIYVAASLFIFGLEEGWMPMDCIYFAAITLTTAGLGDFVPTTDANKLICSIFIYVGVATIGLLLGTYIANLMDDRAHRTARKNQLDACPHCNRLQTMRDAAMNSTKVYKTVREKGSLASRAKATSQLNRALVAGSERFGSNASTEWGQNQFHSVHRKHEKQHSSHSVLSEHNGLHRIIEMEAPSHRFNHSPESGNSDKAEIKRDSSSMSSQQSQSLLLGSPVTRQILGRQSHTRHTSMDVGAGKHIGRQELFGSPYRPGRKYSEDTTGQRGAPPTISENTPLASSFVPSTDMHKSGGGPSDSDGSSNEDEDSSVASIGSSQFSADEILPDDTTTKLKAAKYVFLTLRKALVNSMVIIAVGCAGFRLIEGFSLVDSWYFTTVLLTTVGYGDIVPVTKGGKLFATIYLLVAGTVLINNMGEISMIPIELRRRKVERAVLTQFGDQLDDAALQELATGPVIQRLNISANRSDGLNECTREMFSLAMLVRLGKVSEEDITESFSAFRRLDVNSEGVLNSGSIITGMYKRRRSQFKRKEIPPPTPIGQFYQLSPNPGYNHQYDSHNHWLNPTAEPYYQPFQQEPRENFGGVMERSPLLSGPSGRKLSQKGRSQESPV